MNEPDPNALVAASKAAPILDPQSAVAAAQISTSQIDAVGNATATAGYGTATTKAQAISDLAPAQQTALWNGSTQAEQAQLQGVGYSPPPAPISTQARPAAGTGLLGDIGHALGTAGHDVAHAATDVLNATESPLRAVQHLERAAAYNDVMGKLSAGESYGAVAKEEASAGGGFDTNAFRLAFSPSAWSQAWRETTNGETSFNPALEHQVQASTTNQTAFHVAKQLASLPQGSDTETMENQIVNAYPQAQHLQITQLIQTPEVKQMVNQLQAAKISVGRSAVGEKFMLDHPAAGKVISGTIDAGLDYAQDPTMHIGAATKASDIAKWGFGADRAAQYAAGDSTDMEAAIRDWSTTGGGHRFLKGAADALNSHKASQIADFDPYLASYASDVYKAAHGEAVTADTMRQFYTDGAGMHAILTGKAARTANSIPMLPHLSALGTVKIAAKGIFNKSVNFLADSGTDNDEVLKSLRAVKLAPEDLAGSMHDKMAMDGELPGDGAELATTTLNPPNLANKGGYAASVVRAGPRAVARVIRQMTTLTPTEQVLDLTDPASSVMMRRLLQYSLPAWTVDNLMDVFNTTGDVNQKFAIYKGAVAQMLHLAGLSSGAEGDAPVNEIMSAIDHSFHDETYAPMGLDKYADGTKAGILDSQNSHMVFVPSFKDFHALAKRNAYMSSLRVPIGSLTDQAMSAWRTAVLANPHFSARVATEENISAVLRNGLGPMIAAHSTQKLETRGAQLAANAQRMEDGLKPEYRPMARAIHILTDKVPGPIMNLVRTPRDLAAAMLGHAASISTSPLSAGLKFPELQDAARLMNDHVWDAASPMVSSVEHAGGGYDWAGDITRTMNVGGKPTWMKFVKGGTWSESALDDPFRRQKYQFALGTMADAKFAQQVLTDIDKPRATQMKNLIDLINSPEMSTTKAEMRRGFQMPDLRQVGETGVTQEMVDRDWASRVIDHVNSQVRSGTDGPLIRPLVDTMKQGIRPTSQVLDKVGNAELPDSIYGPEMVAVSTPKQIVEGGMHSLGLMIDNWSRRPIYLHAFARSLRETKPWAEKLIPIDDSVDPALRAQQVELMAAHNSGALAVKDMKPFIHSPEIRSQFEMMHRTAMPFLFAQVQFLKRWARLFSTNPEALAKAQLAMNGLRTSGIVHPDSSGNEVFSYPGGAYVTDLLSRTLNKIGVPAKLNIQVPFTGAINQVIPGLTDPVTPSAGPFVSVGLKAITSRFPEMQGVDQNVLGAGATNGYLEQFMPSTVSRVLQAVTDNPDTPNELASSMMQAIQQAQSTGNGLNPDATLAQQQAYINKITDWSRINMIARAVIGFSAPASPSALFDPKNLNARLGTLMNELPYDQAITEFLKENPNANAYTVFDSKSEGGAVLPATEAAGNWLNTNQAFASNYQMAAGWLIPRTTGNAPFDSAVYREQIQVGLRNEKTAGLLNGQSQFLQDVMAAPAAKQYYAAYTNEQNALNGAQDASSRSAIRSVYDQQKSLFMAQNPAFAATLQSSTAKATREQTIFQLQQALADPNVPKGQQTDDVRSMMNAFDQYQQLSLRYAGQSSYAMYQQSQALQQNFQAWGDSFAQEHPDVSDMWTSLLTPEITDTEAGLGSTTLASTNLTPLPQVATAPTMAAPPPPALALQGVS